MKFDISIIVPVYNEEGNIRRLYSELVKAMPRKYAWEVIFVDDGSVDGSRREIKALAGEHDSVRAIFFSRNYGHQIALTAGYDRADGRAVITMDADLQHPPETIPALLRLWEDGNDIVFAIRDDDKDVSWFKRITSRWFYAFIKAVSHVDLIQGAADFRLLDAKVVYYLRLYQERDRFLRGIISDMGFRRVVHFYREAARQKGVSKYNFSRMMGLALTGILSFSSFPLRICSGIGMFISSLSILYAFCIIYEKFVHGAPVGLPSVLVGVFFIGGVQLIFIGILGEYMMRVFKEVKARPLYCIAELVNCEKPEHV
jgi:polyisoprenyl-phosphate glycosyltransferase